MSVLVSTVGWSRDEGTRHVAGNSEIGDCRQSIERSRGSLLGFWHSEFSEGQ